MATPLVVNASPLIVLAKTGLLDLLCVIGDVPGPAPAVSKKGVAVDDNKLLERITVNPGIFGGKPIIRGRRMAVEHVLGMLAAGETAEGLLEAYPWMERDDVLACLLYAKRVVGNERYEPLFDTTEN